MKLTVRPAGRMLQLSRCFWTAVIAAGTVVAGSGCNRSPEPIQSASAAQEGAAKTGTSQAASASKAQRPSFDPNK